MSQNQFPGQYRSPSTPAVPANPAGTMAPGVTASPEALGVKPDSRLANAFLTQAFVWMFAGLLITAGVACGGPEQSAPARVRQAGASSSCSSSRSGS